MERLSGLDAFFLYLETPTQPLNVCCIVELDTSTMPGGYTYGRFRAALAKHVKAVPEFRMKLADTQLNLDHPVWVDDESFRLGRHVRRIGLPPPAGRRELAEICGYLAGLPLDRDRPLWEMWVIEGCARADAVAVMLKVHHAVVDGVAGANLLAHLCSLQPERPEPLPAGGPGGGSALQIAASGLKGFALRPLRLAALVPATMLTLVQTVLRAREGRTMAAPFAAPPTPFNGSLSRHRTIAFTHLDMRDVTRVKDRFGVTINDVVVALCAGVLRRFLLDRGELPGTPLVATVPVSVRDKSDRPGRNQTTWMFCRVESQISDPAERIRTIAASNAAAKDHIAAIGPTLLHDWTQFGGQTMFGAAMRVLPRILLTSSPVYNLILSNVPGPREQLYFLGCGIDSMYPLGPLLGGAGLNITVMSLNGGLGIGIVSCPDLLPDLWGIADGFADALKELLECGDDRPGRSGEQPEDSDLSGGQ
ncbi:wax ester/triacylglycerol synthase family O-acyltransferase [Mycobacterium shinjukuense]|uniref:Diacylglycerol O-acyltransferase n=1 Tax=Mycobacterium shinjukuense TaxID=398694 RepID=A0A7I7MQD8_9MYCO|nr:wax ester/triacylglycerol synthase family O-acyltransferase [Mycobacterium shinjukuense]MCV6987022.1 wax ester/triacylglycerol synthase family O-acyltransferase [Mycobacterium shinjukuense]ORB71093.1 diacylglycerol O-acyltransferase [Mycobacterium shinjukuense]BBX73529.1 putative diacyglycerol O-acyltransferase [Mycobacterium shinjukuense]